MPLKITPTQEDCKDWARNRRNVRKQRKRL